MEPRVNLPCSPRGKRVLTLVIIILAANTGWASGSDKVSLDVPAGALGPALLEFGKQTNLSIVFANHTTQGLKSQRLQGEFSVAEALNQILTPHCLSARNITEKLIAVRFTGCGAEQSETLATASPGHIKPQNRYPASKSRPPSKMEEIYVRGEYITGSRIRNPQFQQTSRVDVITRPEIERSGHQSVDQLLRYIPAVAGNSTSTLISNGGDGTSTVTLRGLPASNTLVLLNGRRTNPDAFGGTAVDLNTLPMALIERIEILKDGVSAIYGSDAVAGVVNIVTRKDVNGIKLSTYLGGAGEGDLETQNYSIVYGDQQDRFRYSIGGSFYDQGSLNSRDRSLSDSSDGREQGGIDMRSSATAPARITLPEGPVLLGSNQLDGSDPTQFREANIEDRFEYRASTTSIVPSRRWSAFADIEWMLSDRITLFAEALFTDTSSSSTLAPTPLFTGFETTPLTISANNIYNPFGIDLIDVRRRLSELKPRQQTNKSNSERFLVGLEHRGEKVFWRTSVQHHVTNAKEDFANVLNATSTQQALGPDCVDNCVPLNLLGPLGSITPEMIGFVRADLHTTGRSELNSFTVDIDFPAFKLPAGTIEIASGIEYREEFVTVSPDELLANNEALGAVNFGPTDGDRSIWGVYVEAYIPLIREVDGIHLLDLHLAGRTSNYSDFGKTSNPRVALRYQPVPSLTFRASWGKGFRAPTLRQLFGGEQQSFEQLNDPCSIANNLTMPGCSEVSDPTLVQFLTSRSGDENLKAESSKTTNIGVVWQPVSLPGTLISLDLYRIRQKNVVDHNAQFIINSNVRSGDFADQVSRDQNGNITRVTSNLMNIGRRDVSGLDVGVSTTTRDYPWGRLEFALNASHIHRFADKLDPTSDYRDQAGTFKDDAAGGNGALPDWKANINLVWSREHWQVNYDLHYVSSVDEVVPIIEENRTIQSWRTHNFRVSYFGPQTRWVKISSGINNFLDEAPPFSAAAFNDNYDARTYDITGRYWYVQLDKSI